MQIRPAIQDDLPGIVALLADDPLGAGREDARLPLAAPYRAAFEAIETDPNHLIVVAEDGGELLATLQLTFLPSLTHRGGLRAQVEAVRVAGAHRGGGLGRRLLTWAIEEADRRGCHLVQLTTDVQRPDALRFYRSLGFEPTHHGLKRYLGAEDD